MSRAMCWVYYVGWVEHRETQHCAKKVGFRCALPNLRTMRNKNRIQYLPV